MFVNSSEFAFSRLGERIAHSGGAKQGKSPSNNKSQGLRCDQIITLTGEDTPKRLFGASTHFRRQNRRLMPETIGSMRLNNLNDNWLCM
jgi:hypothetical protein